MVEYSFYLRSVLVDLGYEVKSFGAKYVAGETVVFLSSEELEMERFGTIKADSAEELAKKTRKAIELAKRAKAQADKIEAEMEALLKRDEI